MARYSQSITPESQPALLHHHEQRLHAALPEVLQPWPQLQHALEQAESYGVMRWGAAVPTAGGLPAHLQWCEEFSGICRRLDQWPRLWLRGGGIVQRWH